MDVVYILRNGIDSEELKYSLRSLKNFPHDKVWFFGGVPKGLKPDVQVAFRQEGRNKWEKVRNSLIRVCKTEELSSSFWLFNDDFFCMKPCDGIPPFYYGDLYERIAVIEKRHHGMTTYSKQLRDAAQELDSKGLGILNYALHMPLQIDKARALVVLEEFKTCPMFRCLYGNSCEIGGAGHEDVKIMGPSETPSPDADWLSTSDRSFSCGDVGRYIREQFKEKCEYELG